MPLVVWTQRVAMASPSSRNVATVCSIELVERSRQLNILYADIFPKLDCIAILLSSGWGFLGWNAGQRVWLFSVRNHIRTIDPSKAANNNFTPAAQAGRGWQIAWRRWKGF